MGPETGYLKAKSGHGRPKLGVPGLPKVEEETLLEGTVIADPGSARHDGDLPAPLGESGEDDRGGGRGFKPT